MASGATTEHVPRSSSAEFDQQIEGSRTLADTAIMQLPGINATIQQAVRDNTRTGSILRDVSGDYDDTAGTIDQLNKLVNSLEVTSIC